MIKIEKIGNSVTITHGNLKQSFPLGVLIAHYSEKSENIDIKYKGSRKVVVSAPISEYSQGNITNINNLIN